MKNLFDAYKKLNGASFISITGYESTTSGQIADHVINTGISVKTAKEKDLKTLQICSETDLAEISAIKGIDLNTCKLALAEMLASAEKNLSANLEDRTQQSQGQTDAYLTHPEYVGLKIHKETMALHIFGMKISKNILKEGTYKVVNSSAKTLAKKGITKYLNLRAGKFQNFIVANAEYVNIAKEHIKI